MDREARIVAVTLSLVLLATTAGDAWPRHPGSAPPTASRPGWHRPWVVPSSVIRVRDGDTFVADGETIRIRGIDTPEWGQPRARAAAARLAELLRTGPVTIVPRAQDVYRRTVADVYVGSHDVARVLRQEGLEKPRPARVRPCAPAGPGCRRTITRTRPR
jgi:endonuclease YncB( thermonuclease family)